MSIIQEMYDLTKDKIESLCFSNRIDCDIQTNQYPIVFKFRIMEDGEILTTQTSCAEMVFEEELQIRTTADFSIDEKTFNKIKNLSKKAHHLYLHAFFETKKLVENS